MRVSLFEIETTLRKAAIGAGLSNGLAEDIGNAAAWLASREYNSVEAVLAAIRAGMSKPEMRIDVSGAVVFPDARIANCGPSAIDILVDEKTCDKVYLHNVDSTVLLIGLAGIGANHHALEFLISFSDSAEVLVSTNAAIEKGPIAMSNCNIVLTCRKISEAPGNISTPTQGVFVDDKLWHEACLLATRTHVPESQASRTTGAGASLTDND